MDTKTFFNSIYELAASNAIVIMDTTGTILEVNSAFTKNYGFTTADVQGKSFKLFFTKSDKQKRMPEKELQKVTTTGQSSDDNFIVDKQGIPKRSSGESILVKAANGEHLIVKMIVNLHSKKYLRLLFSETDKLLEAGLSTSTEVPMITLDPSMKILQVNEPFLTLFAIKEKPSRGTRLSALQHPFWKRADVKQLIRETIVGNAPLKRKRFDMQFPEGKKKLSIDSKIIESTSSRGKKVFVIIEEIG